MCSACLTPVYPMEKIVANKLILHNKCFCCKHCQKKLSIHNYSSLYGDFYCMSHYLQLFKRKRNDQGFGGTPNKDHWLQKDKGTDEVDTTTAPKMTKSNSNSSNISRDSSAEVAIAKTRETDMRNASQGKLKVNWPPQKNQPRHDLNAPSFKLKDKLVMSTHAKMSEIKGKSPKTDQTSEEPILEEPKFRSGATKTKYFQDSPAELQRPFHLPEKDAKKKQTAAVAVDKINVNKGTNKLDMTSNKTAKSVRFAPTVDISDYDQTCQLATGGDAKDDDVIGLHVKMCNNANDTLDDSEQSRKLREIQHEEKPTTIDAAVKSPALLQNEDKKDEQRHLDDGSSDKMDIELEKANPLTKPELPETLSESNRRKDDKTELTKEHNPNQQVLAKTNSPMSREKQPDRSKVRLGSWYKGRSPLSKLFAASGTENPSKTEAKTAVGLPGRVVQSSSDKNKDATKLAACDNEPKMDTDEKNRDEADTVRVEPEEDAENRRLAPDFNMLDSSKVETVNTELEIPTSETSVGLTDLVQTETPDTNPADDTSNETPLQPETDWCKELPSIATCGPQESTHELTVDQNGILSTPELTVDQNGILSVGSEPVFTECNQDVDELDNATKAKDWNIDQNTFLDVDREASQASPDPPDQLIPQESLGDNPVDALFSVTNDASSEGLSLLDTQPEPSQTEKLGLEELATPPDADGQPLSTLTPNNTEESILDIFSSNSVLFAQQPVATIFAEGEMTSEVLLTPSVAPPPQGDLFFLDMFASEMLPKSQESSDVPSPLGGVMEKKNPEQSVANAMTHSNWMDDLLG